MTSPNWPETPEWPEVAPEPRAEALGSPESPDPEPRSPNSIGSEIVAPSPVSVAPDPYLAPLPPAALNLPGLRRCVVCSRRAAWGYTRCQHHLDINLKAQRKRRAKLGVARPDLYVQCPSCGRVLHLGRRGPVPTRCRHCEARLETEKHV